MAWADPEEVEKIRQLLSKRMSEENATINDPEKLESVLLAFVEELFEQADEPTQDTIMTYIDGELA